MSSYIPFLIMPLTMAVDGARRILRLMNRVQALEKAAKHL